MICCVLFSLVLVSILQPTSGVSYHVINHARDTPGGKRFRNSMEDADWKKIMQDASKYTWKVFGQSDERKRRNTTSITLHIKELSNLSCDFNPGNIFINADYINNMKLECFREEITGIIYQGVVPSWQWGLNGSVPLTDTTNNLLLAIGAFVRIKKGYAPSDWKKGMGSRWDENYIVMGRFLKYCDKRFKKTFVMRLNLELKSQKYDPSFFNKLGDGSPVDKLWVDYKNKYGH